MKKMMVIIVFVSISLQNVAIAMPPPLIEVTPRYVCQSRLFIMLSPLIIISDDNDEVLFDINASVTFFSDEIVVLLPGLVINSDVLIMFIAVLPAGITTDYQEKIVSMDIVSPGINVGTSFYLKLLPWPW